MIVWYCRLTASARENIASKETEVDEDDGKTENKAFKESRDQRIQSASDHTKVSKPTTSGSTNLKNSSEGSSCAVSHVFTVFFEYLIIFDIILKYPYRQKFFWRQ